jgi:flagellar protein FliS
MYQTGCNAYRQSAGNTLEDRRVVLLKLYDGILKFLAQARRGILEGSPKIRGENISKIMAIVTELECALDHEKGGEIAANLSSLYQYITNRLTEASIKNDVEALDHVKEIISMLKDAFETAIQEQKKSTAAYNNTRAATNHHPEVIPPGISAAAPPERGVQFAL